MATFSPTDAALEGFRQAREKPRVLLIWAAVNFVVSALVGVLLIAVFGERLAELDAAQSGELGPGEALAAFGPMYALMLPIGLAAMAVFNAAAFRMVLRPHDSRYGYLRLGPDELRLAALALIFFLIALVGITVITVVAALLGEGAAAVGGTAGALLEVAVFLATVGFLIFATVRLSLAGPITFAEGRLRVFESWRLTRGNFWRLFGAYALAVILIVVMFLLAAVIYTAVAAIIAGGDLAAAGQLSQPDANSIADFMTPAMLVYLVFVALFSALQNVVLYSPPAVAYRQLTQGA